MYRPVLDYRLLANVDFFAIVGRKVIFRLCAMGKTDKQELLQSYRLVVPLQLRLPYRVLINSIVVFAVTV